MPCLSKAQHVWTMMLIMGNSNRIWHYWAGRYPGSVGVLIGPSYEKKVPLDPWMPFVLDNDAYICFKKQTEWDVSKWREMLGRVKMTGLAPLWAAVPDVVANKKATIENWKKYSHEIKAIGWPTAFVVQDGMHPEDVPDADVIFVGGSDAWKFPNLKTWTSCFKRVHCGRVNAIDMIERCEELGCESVDGTGWFMEPSRPDKVPALKRFVEGFRKRDQQHMLCF